jgi:hypothetical protein
MSSLASVKTAASVAVTACSVNGAPPHPMTATNIAAAFIVALLA